MSTQTSVFKRPNKRRVAGVSSGAASRPGEGG